MVSAIRPFSRSPPFQANGAPDASFSSGGLLVTQVSVLGGVSAFAQQPNGPNHRYTDSLTIFNQMLAQGWVFDGEAVTKLFACGPAL